MFEQNVSKVIIRLMEYFDLCYWLTERSPSFEMHENKHNPVNVVPRLKLSKSASVDPVTVGS